MGATQVKELKVYKFLLKKRSHGASFIKRGKNTYISIYHITKSAIIARNPLFFAGNKSSI